MRRSQGFWLLAWLSASCAVRGFTIEDELPGGNGGSAGSAVGGSQSGSGGQQSQGGDGVAGTMAQGGKVGSAGSQGEAGTPTVDGGEPSLGGGGEGAGGAPPATTAPCDLNSNGQPPLLCDDFESGTLAADKWTAPVGVGAMMGDGPHGATRLVHLNSPALDTKLGALPISDAGGLVTVSFWVMSPMDQPFQPIMSFRDRSAAASSLRLSAVQEELGWRNSSFNFYVPQAPTGNQFIRNIWTCVSIILTASSLELRYQSQGSTTISTLIADSEPTPNIDANWNNAPADNRFVSGYPSFGGIFDGVATDIYLDDVRIVVGTSNVCGF